MRTVRLLVAGALVGGVLLAAPTADAAEGYLPQITNGNDAPAGAHPFMVALLSSGDDDRVQAQFCGGSLISELWVVTAAHCVVGAGHADLDVLSGSIDLTAQDGRRTGVRKIIVHPDYDDFDVVNDIALLRLATPITDVQPIALADGTTIGLEVAGTAATLVGWGGITSTVDYPEFPTLLQEATVPVASDAECRAGLGGDVDVASIICAGAPESDADGGIGSCYGDSGGPLLVTEPSGRRVLVGIVSYGSDSACGIGLTAYTRVSAYREWIDDMVAANTGPPSVDRLAGSNRYATAAALATDRWEAGVPTAFVVTGETFPDALAAAPAAVRLGAPLLLTERDALPPETFAALRALRPDEIVVVGGEGAISDAVVAALEPLARLGVERIAGATRFDTAAALSRSSFPSGTPPVAAFLASGEQFADALGGAAAAAAGLEEPLLLTGRDALPLATRIELGRLGADVVYVLGGTAAVSDAVVEAVEALGSPVVRLAGDDRYETSAIVVEILFGPSNEVVLATGTGFPDGLVAGALASPVLLLPPSGVPSSIAMALNAVDPFAVLILGGTGSVPTATERAIVEMVRSE